MIDLAPVAPPDSFAKVFAREAEYKAMADEYKALMKRLNHSCVGKDKAAAECVRAAQLNADMQTTLGELSDTLKVTGAPKKKPSVMAQQQKLLELADGLEAEYAKLTAAGVDASVTTTMYKTHYLAWGLGVIFLAALIWTRARAK